MEISREESTDSSFPASPDFSPPQVKPCKGACMLRQAGPVVVRQPWAAASGRVGAVKGSRTWAVGGKGSAQGLYFLTPPKHALVSPQFHQCFAGRVSLTNLAVFIIATNLQDAPSPWLLQEPFWSLLESCGSPLHLLPSHVFASPAPDPLKA